MVGRVAYRQGDALAAAQSESFDHFFCNPPFHDSTGQQPPDSSRARSLHDVGTLKDWVRSGLERVASKGSFTIILRADRLDEALNAAPNTGAHLLPLLPRAGERPKRIIAQIRKSQQLSLITRPGLVLHNADGSYTKEAEAVLRGGRGLDF
jgi:tRNA1(Val) A37 N6-methylase TrmN6